ncbi:MAG: hypothetical protein EAZ87_02380 [Nostocales cyanobacterium]|nr:MAG: hypothetical protein EAZ87_02380 [Nostocales cyanobacterium]
MVYARGFMRMTNFFVTNGFLRPGRGGGANVDSVVDPADLLLDKGFEDFVWEFMALVDSVFRPGRKWHLDIRLGKGLE